MATASITPLFSHLFLLNLLLLTNFKWKKGRKDQTLNESFITKLLLLSWYFSYISRNWYYFWIWKHSKLEIKNSFIANFAFSPLSGFDFQFTTVPVVVFKVSFFTNFETETTEWNSFRRRVFICINRMIIDN